MIYDFEEQTPKIDPGSWVAPNAVIIGRVELKKKSNIGEDNLILFFKINENADLLVQYFDIKNEFLGEYNLGNIF